MSEIWFTSDLHFGHANIVEYCNRPWTIEEQTEELIKRWNDRVGLMDTAYHLGDFTFAGKKGAEKTVEIIKRLNGKITFIKGNHCQPTLWDEIAKYNLPHIEDVRDYKEITIDRTKVCLFHFPLEIWNKAHHGAWHLHGHSHGSCAPRGKRLDVGIDNHPDRQVFSLAEVKIHMAKQEFVIVDHHTGERD